VLVTLRCLLLFIRAEGFNTQELAARGSLGAFLMLLNPECNSTNEIKLI